MCEQFILRWHYHEITLLRNLPIFYESDILTDVTLSIGSHSIKAHKLVLAMCSVYFFQLFQEMGNIQHPVIILHNVCLDDIKAVLSFIYRGQCVVSKEQLPSLLSLAKLLKIQGLCDMKVPDKIPADNSITITDKETTTNNHNNNNNENLNPQIEETVNKLNENSTNFWEKPQTSTDVLVKKTNSKDSSETCKCFLCGKYLSNQYNLRVHMETHEEAYHACQSCPHVSRSRDALRKHVSYRHPEEYNTRKRKKNESNNNQNNT